MPTLLYAQDADSTSQAARAAIAHAVDSAYIRILERDVSSLGTWVNALGAGLGLVAALFAAGAIAAAILLWRQSKEYRETVDRELARYRELFEGLLGQLRQEHEAAIDRIKLQEESLQSQRAEADQQRKDQIDAELARLQTARSDAEAARTKFLADRATQLQPGTPAWWEARNRGEVVDVYHCPRCDEMRHVADLDIALSPAIHLVCRRCRTPVEKVGENLRP